jgi:hypothetical protein
VSGKDNGYSYNTARFLLRLYDNAIDFGVQMISPIASNAFSYNYKLESTFFDENKKDD